MARRIGLRRVCDKRANGDELPFLCDQGLYPESLFRFTTRQELTEIMDSNFSVKETWL
jgi:hypothetical protein